MNPQKILFGILRSLRAGLAGIISLAFLLSTPATSQATSTRKPDSTPPNPHILQDINQEPLFATGYRFFWFGGHLFFDIQAYNCQVWRSDGSTAGTELFLEITYGSGSRYGYCLDPYVAGDLLYFPNTDPDHGSELWVSDGTQAGTHILRDINPGPEGIFLWNIFPLGNKLFFFAGDSSDKVTLWVTDGSQDGTVALYSGIPTFDDYPFFPMYNVQGLVYFFGNDPTHGRELWRSDGTPQGTYMLKDILPGSDSSYPTILGVYDDTLYFSADDGIHGTELWKSDGTPQGTSMVKDIFPGGGSSDPFIVKIEGETLYIRAYDGVHGFELWRSDGSESGTQLIKDINPGPSSSLSDFPNFTGLYFTPFNGDLFFTADDGTHGIELWKTDGTTSGTQMLTDFSAGSASSNIADLQILNGVLIILESPLDGGTYGLWRSDGTTSGTTLLKNNFVGNFVATSGGQLFFEVDETNLAQLFKTDGTLVGTSLVHQFSTGVKNISGFADLNGNLYFTINLSPEGVELWRSDGTPAGTIPVLQNEQGVSSLGTWNGSLLLTRDISDTFHELWSIDGATQSASLLKGADPDQINVVGVSLLEDGNQFYFLDYDHAHSSALWRSDGSPAGTQLVRSLTGTGDLSVKDLTIMANSVFFKGNSSSYPSDQVNLYRLDPNGQVNQILAEIGTSFWTEGLFVVDKNLLFVVDAKNPYQPAGLWRSDGTQVGTDLLLAEPNPNGFLMNTTLSGNQLFFIAREVNSEQSALWRTDGSPTGTWMVLDLSNIGSLAFIADVNGVLFGVGNYKDKNSFLMVSDGTPAGTHIIQEFPGFFFPDQYLAWNGALFFQGSNSLWVSSGTSSSTHILVQFTDTFIQGLTKTDRLVFFNADDGSHGVELWKTDGTQAGTSLVKDIYPGGGGSDPQPVATIGSTLYFTADDGMHGRELWRSDGTEAGTYLVKDIRVGKESSNASSFVVLHDVLYFSARGGQFGQELWRSDGTEAGTYLVKDILPGASSSAPEVSVEAGRLYLAANDGVHGIEPWVSDGTESGTFMLGDINPGPSSSNPDQFTYWRGKVYFEAGDFEHGRELWVYELGLTARSYMPLLAR